MTAEEYLVPLQDRSLSGSVWKVIICPQMELVAVVLDRNSITIYRTTWQRLAAIPICSAENEVITSVAWSPDGAYIVVGTSSQTLAIYSVDRAASTPAVRTKRGSRETEPVVTRQLSAVPTTILWSTKPSTVSKNAILERCATYEDRFEKIHESKSQEHNESCDGLLLVGDAAGAVTILTHNLLLSIARISAAPNGFDVNRIHLSSSHRYCLTSSSSGPRRKEDSRKENGNSQFVLRAFDLSAALDYWTELDRLGQDVMNFMSTIKKLSQEFKSVHETWIEGALQVLDSTVRKPLEELMGQFAEECDSPWQALHDVYCGARMKGAVLQFLASTLGENGAKEALRSFGNHADDTYATVFSMIPIAQKTVFASSEYRGLARLESRFKPAGVELSGADTLFHASEKLLWSIGDLVTEIESVTQEMEAFLAWLVLAAAKAGGESAQTRPTAIPTNVSGKDADLISSFFKKQSASASNSHEANKTIVTLLANEVQPALVCFERAVERLVSRPCDVISSKLKPFEEISFADGRECSSSSAFTSVTFNFDKSDTREVTVVPSVGAGFFVSVKFDFARAKWTVRRYSLAKLGLHVQSAVMLSRNVLLAVTTETLKGEGDDKSPSSISLYELPGEDSDNDSMMDDSEAYQGKRITLPEATDLSPGQLDIKSCGNITHTDGAAVSVNSQLGLICVLAAPRKIYLFQTPHQAVHR